MAALNYPCSIKFYEEMPDMHVVAAGSLFEFAIDNISLFL